MGLGIEVGDESGGGGRWEVGGGIGGGGSCEVGGAWGVGERWKMGDWMDGRWALALLGGATQVMVGIWLGAGRARGRKADGKEKWWQ